MYSSATEARNYLRSAIACLIVGYLFLLLRTGMWYVWTHTLIVPVLPLVLSIRNLDRGSYQYALWCAWLGVAACVLAASLWGVVSDPGLFALVGLLFSCLAGIRLQRLSQRNP
jgi:hypothetical protein